MYVRRKVFSIANDYDDFDNSYDEFDDYFSQRLYSEAFEDGIDYAIEKMFADKLPPATSPLAIGPAGDPGLRGNYEKSLWDKIKNLPKSIKDRYMKAGKWGKAGMIAAAAAPVLAAAGYGIHKATKKDKTYSEGFEAGVDYAIEKLFFDPENISNSEYNDLINRTRAEVEKQKKEKAEKLAKEQAEKLAKENRKKVEQAFVDMYEHRPNLPALVGKGKDNPALVGGSNPPALVGGSNPPALVGKGKDNPVSGVVDAKYYEDLYRKGEISRKELETALEAARNENSALKQGLRTTRDKQGALEKGLKAAQDKIEGYKTAFNTEQMLHDNTRKAKEAAEKLAKRWKYGAIGAGVVGAGVGTAGMLRGRRRD